MTRLKSTRAETGQDGIGIREPGSPIGGGGDGEVKSPAAGHFLGERFDDVQAFRLEIDENDFRAIEVPALVNERSHGSRRTRATSPDIGELDSRHSVPSL